MQNPKWKLRSGNTLSLFYAKPNHQAQVRLRKDESKQDPVNSLFTVAMEATLCRRRSRSLYQ